ncbi:hypothetical protein VE02_08249 [Pseudogymnoascus sp. 03VT05]|nr:hypothetical protein VE02_08249 [Pseudogymnoascus sp. 03VT05]
MGTSAHAKHHWYFGLTSRFETDPELIARSSTAPYRYEAHNFESYFPKGPELPQKKKMSVIGSHPILAVYDKHLRSRVLEALAQIPWQTVDVVRLGYVDNQENPPVVLVTIKKEDVDESRVQVAVNEIRKIMAENNLMDVHAETKTGHLFYKVDCTPEKICPLALNRTPLLGSSLENDTSSVGRGSLCLYVKIDGELYGLTCKHAVMPMNLSRTGATLSDNSTVEVGDHIVFQPARVDFEREEAAIAAHIAMFRVL